LDVSFRASLSPTMNPLLLRPREQQILRPPECRHKVLRRITTHQTKMTASAVVMFGTSETCKTCETWSLTPGGEIRCMGQGGAQILIRIHWNIVDTNFVMQMGRGGSAAGTDISDHFTAVDSLAGNHRKCR